MDDEDLEVLNLLNVMNNQNNVENLLNFHIIEQIMPENIHLRKTYRIKKRIHPFEDLDDNEFKRRFRFSKNEVHTLYDLIDGANTLEPKVNFSTKI